MSGTAKTMFYAGLALIVLGGFGSVFPLWKSRRLSPAAIRRRVFWTGAVGGCLLLFVAVLPDWRSGLFVGLGILFALAIAAFRFTSHIKIGDTIYAYSPSNRRPDPPPALAPNSERR